MTEAVNLIILNRQVAGSRFQSSSAGLGLVTLHQSKFEYYLGQEANVLRPTGSVHSHSPPQHSARR